MGIRVHKEHAYDDVTLLASTDLEASQWTLEERDESSAWRPIQAVIEDSNLNWSTPDLSLWGGLCRGDADAIKRAFPEARSPSPAGVPFAVMWDVSRWVYDWSGHRFRFTGPDGSTYEFQHAWDQPEYSFG